MTTRMQTVMSAAVAALLVGATALPLAAQGPGTGMGPGPGGGGMAGPGGKGPGGCAPMMLLTLDADQDGKITEEEFMSGHGARFEALDANNDGTISFEELKAWRQPRNEQRMQAMFRRGDTNGDGVISREEFNGTGELRFEGLDANKDGALTEDEIQAIAANKRCGPKMMGPGAGQGMMGGQGMGRQGGPTTPSQ